MTPNATSPAPPDSRPTSMTGKDFEIGQTILPPIKETELESSPVSDTSVTAEDDSDRDSVKLGATDELTEVDRDTQDEKDEELQKEEEDKIDENLHMSNIQARLHWIKAVRSIKRGNRGISVVELSDSEEKEEREKAKEIIASTEREEDEDRDDEDTSETKVCLIYFNAEVPSGPMP